MVKETEFHLLSHMKLLWNYYYYYYYYYYSNGSGSNWGSSWRSTS